MRMCVYLCERMPHERRCPACRKRALDILCLEWVLGTELGFSVTVVSALNHSAISPASAF